MVTYRVNLRPLRIRYGFVPDEREFCLIYLDDF
jgi:hypothetical protein